MVGVGPQHPTFFIDVILLLIKVTTIMVPVHEHHVGISRGPILLLILILSAGDPYYY